MEEWQYLEKKADLDQRKQAAERVIAEYERTLKGNILTDDDIDETMRELEELHAWLSPQKLTHQRKVALLDAMHVTGVMYADKLKLYVYRIHLADLNFGEELRPRVLP